METNTFTVEGMSCEACVRAVTNALQDLEGVQQANVNLQQKRATVTYDPARVGTIQMQQAVEEEGYSALPLE